MSEEGGSHMDKRRLLGGVLFCLFVVPALADALLDGDMARSLSYKKSTQQEAASTPPKAATTTTVPTAVMPAVPAATTTNVLCEVRGGQIYKMDGNKMQPSKWLRSCGAFPKQAFKKDAVTACLRHRGYSEILFEDNTTIQIEENVPTGDLCHGKWDNTAYKAGVS
ncbi:hypothetical protein QU481_06860 [Crenobacter sp. SG2303]|uniref:Uncharacterized protein n=1 Tax=Crenobacter oryzisoli TaxID=3056844 RepID=A0ABT7XLF4_9NEIS|nr:hypothetical protein [Crenobacter sp. SG2303]MDN0074611.1 hypothetical protein [Crenobacter sp. SG2303]